jgi:hypothetical protein
MAEAPYSLTNPRIVDISVLTNFGAQANALAQTFAMSSAVPWSEGCRVPLGFAQSSTGPRDVRGSSRRPESVYSPRSRFSVAMRTISQSPFVIAESKAPTAQLRLQQPILFTQEGDCLVLLPLHPAAQSRYEPLEWNHGRMRRQRRSIQF